MTTRSFFKGMTYGWGAGRGDYRQPYAVDSLRNLRETGSEWIALSFWTYQDHVYSTSIPFDYGYTMTDRDIAFAVKEAKALGLKVCLKPVVNSRDGIWRAHIGFPDDAMGVPYWDAWFKSYTNFICHYAELAEELGCEMFCIGCEMVKTESKSEYWRALIERVRSIYSGPIIYNGNHGKEEGISWFDAVDYIGTSAYYPVGKRPGDSVESMMEGWEEQKAKLAALSRKFGKPVVFMEIGCRSALGCATMPWDFLHKELPASEDEQANFYQSALQSFWDEPWFAGFFWWDWSTKLYALEEAGGNKGFDIYGKKAGDVLKQYYGGKLPVGV
ncbi:glycosyl hydrolase family 53 [Paenibacillus sp. LHD-117]|uniref:glycoside hydrolase family 113 n=1 Tax=Paenibacillus sp. LHD-117 TaxID=3071412 RepID=UPI0027DEB1CE|nr:glycosyl hydrolase family 53 [Paenibacillus sp. LHD-117]MDQ6422892.1 glycosyl hydrolase family 53 [Paenibacillus sp. LHD-117]